MANIALTQRVDGSRPWMGLPVERVPEGVSVKDAMATANMLDWDLRLEEIVTPAKVDTKAFELLRTDPSDGLPHRLSITGERYVPVSNEDLAQMANTVTSGEVTPDVVGTFRNGRSVFMTFCLGENIILDPNGQADEIGRYLTIRSSNDGSAAIQAFTHNMRLDCQNMLTSAKSHALSAFSMRHTQNVEGRIADARKALAIAFKQGEVFAAEMEALMTKEVSDDKFWEIVTTIFPEPEKDVRGSLKKWENKTGDLVGLWNGETMANLDNTAYKAYNALNEHLMWYTGIRDGNVENALVRASGFNEADNKKNLSLYNRVLTLA